MSDKKQLADMLDRAVSYQWFKLLASYRIACNRKGATIIIPFHNESNALEFQKLVQRAKKRKPV